MSNKRKVQAHDKYPVKRSSSSNGSDCVAESSDDNSIDNDHSIDILSPNSNCSRFEKPQSGIIESISLRQFMCHTHLDAKLGSKVNFIIGKNGSGKSAIMTAVVIGLGGTASCTSRGSNVKNFIQQGKQIAEINIKLNNTGLEPYKPEVYGKSIIVQRVIRSTGVSTYNIKDHSGIVVENRKSELNTILDYFNIQVDNPISILNQELSRQFLRTEDPKTKYKLFLRATQLEQISRNYQVTDQNRRYAAELLETKKKSIPELQRQLVSLKIKYDFFLSLDSLKQKKNALRAECCWSKIVSFEKELEEDLSAVEEVKSKLDKFDSRISRLQVKEDELKSKDAALSTQINSLQADLSTLEPAKQQKKVEMDNKRKEIQQLTLSANSLNSKIRTAADDRKKLNARIQEIQSVEADKFAAENESRKIEIRNLEAELENLNARYLTTTLESQQLGVSVQKFSADMHKLRMEEQTHQNRLGSIRRKLQDAESTRGNQQKKFGQWVPEALKQIDTAYDSGVFRKKPKGPLGLYINVRDSKWSLAIETCLKPFLFSFICDNRDDERKLQSIIANVIKGSGGRMPPITTIPFQDEVYDVSSHRVQSENYHSILDMLKIDDSVITNSLIDQCEIECILLIDDDDKASSLMLHHPPANCRMAYTLRADRIYPKPNYRYYSGRNTQVHYFKGVEDNIAILKNEMAEMDTDIKKVKHQISTTEADLNANKRKSNEADDHMIRLRSKISQNKRRLTELKSVEDTEPVYVAALEDDVKILTQQIQEYETQCSEIELTLRSSKSEFQILQDEFSKVDKDLRLKSGEILVPLKESMIIIKSDLAEVANKLKRFNDGKSKIIEEVELKESECRKKQTDIERCVTEATSLSERPKNIRDEDEIKREAEEIEKHLKQEQELRGSKDEVIFMYLEAVKKYDTIKADVKHLEWVLLEIEKLIKVRRSNYIRFREAVAVRVALIFSNFYNRRNRGKGSIDFNHKNETLIITARPNNVTTGEAQNMRSLSGGERSFSTVAFILALWEAIESPFRMLDEFDVFMDMVNRRLSMGILLDFAKSHPFNQFVFFTPLEMTTLNASNDVRILKMKDPERNQSVLPFHPISNNETEDE